MVPATEVGETETVTSLELFPEQTPLVKTALYTVEADKLPVFKVVLVAPPILFQEDPL